MLVDELVSELESIQAMLRREGKNEAGYRLSVLIKRIVREGIEGIPEKY